MKRLFAIIIVLCVASVVNAQSLWMPGGPSVLKPIPGWRVKASSINNTIIIDGDTYAETDVGLQAAITALPAGGGTILIPPNTEIVCTSGVTITKSNVAIIGNGPTSLLSTTGMSDTFIIVGDSAAANYCYFADFQIDGTNQTYSPVGDWGIEHDKGGCGILFDEESGVGVAYGVVKNVILRDIPNEAIGFFGYRPGAADVRRLNALVDGCTIINVGCRAIHPHNDHSVRVINNIVKDCSGAHLGGMIRHGRIIANNVIDNCVDSGATGSAIMASDVESLVTGNIIVNSTMAEYLIHGWSGEECGSIISNNTIYNCSASSAIALYKYDRAYNNIINESGGTITTGISTTVGKGDNVISGNHISGGVFIGIAAWEDNCQITNNTISGANYPIRISGDYDGIEVRNNTTDKAGDYRIEAPNALWRDNTPDRVYAGEVLGNVTYPFTLTTAAPDIFWWMPTVLLDTGSNAVDAVLPDPTAWAGQRVTVRAADVTNSCKVSPHVGEEIDGAVQEITFVRVGDVRTFLSDGTNWRTVSTANDTGMEDWYDQSVKTDATPSFAGVRLPADGAELNLGATVDDFIMEWDGNDAVYTIKAGQFRFVDGHIEIIEDMDEAATFGAIMKGGTRWMHNYVDPDGNGTCTPYGRNLFLGLNSGNFTVGSTATANFRGSDNVGLGDETLFNLTWGSGNFAGGFAAGWGITYGSTNMCLGSEAGRYNRTGGSNTFVGSQSGKGIINSSDIAGNSLLGFQTGRALLTGGDYNIFIGYQTGILSTTSDHCIIIGHDLDAPTITTDYHLNIGGVIQGNLSTGVVGIMTATPHYPFTVNGGVGLLEKSADPVEPAEGEAVIWMSDGTGKGDDGDVLIGAQAGSVTRWTTLFDHSTGAAW